MASTFAPDPARAPVATPMIETSGLSKHYGGVAALSNVDLSVHKGEFVTLLGPSGSGKSTLLNLIAGMTTPTSGSLRLNGRDAAQLPTNRRELGMVFQNYALMPHLTIFDNVAFPLRVRKVSRAEIRRRVMDVLDLVSLAHTAQRKPSELSGGQQQRVSLARCIVYNPLLILMDEPLGALDKQLREHMQLEIKRLHSALGVTMLYVTHDQDEALTMSDRIVLMHDGKIEQQGKPEELYFSPRTRFAASFIGHSNLIDGTVSPRGCAIETAFGALHAGHRCTTLEAGNQAAMLVRPESVELLDDATVPDGWNVVSGTLDDSVVLGGVVRHFLRLAGGGTMVVQELNRQRGERHARGCTLRAGWRHADARLLPA
jgi:putative spermidine/putrescine transport system ATP-binding protein